MKLLSRKRFLFFVFLLAMNLVQAQTILKQNGKFGLSDEDGTVVLEPKYDTVEQSYFVNTTYNRKHQLVLFKRSAPAPLFFIKQNGKFAYTYKVDIDSTKVLKEEQEHWTVSEFEFDSLAITSVGSSYYYDSYGFTTMIYKKNGKWGMIYIQTYTSSGGGMFPSVGFYADGMGKQYRTPPKYDTIFHSQLDFFHPTFLNGKYGLINPVSGEEYAPEFDTIPVYITDLKRRVKKNGKWGVIEMIQQTRTLHYIAPCNCYKVEKMDDDLYVCSGTNDTIRFFDSERDSTYTPLYNNEPLIFKDQASSIYITIYDYNDEARKLMVIAIRSPDKDRYSVFREVHLYSLASRQLISYNENGYKYSFNHRGIISRYKADSSSRLTHYEFFNFETQELRFAFDLDSSLSFYEEEYTPSRRKPSVPYIHRIYSQDKYLNERTIGYYNYRTEKFSRRKPGRRQLR